MNEKTSQLFGLIGFVIAGVLFVIIGVRDGDWLVIAASMVWNIACLIWLWPFIRRDR